MGVVFNDVMYGTDSVSISRLVFGPVGGNEFHSGRKDRSVSFVVKHALNKNLCLVTFDIRKIMLHINSVQMKIIKINIDIYSNLSTLCKIIVYVLI